MGIKIALAADTILYYPFYIIRERNLLPHLDIELETVDGDEAAYDRLANGPANLCVCDPMVLAQKAAALPERRTEGVVVAALVSRTGLWGINAGHISVLMPKSRGSFHDHLKMNQLEIGNVLTYDTSSTGGQAVDYLISHKFLPGGKQYKTQFGKELEFLSQPLKTNNGDVLINLVVTCDLIGVFACERLAHQLYPNARCVPQMLLDLPRLAPFSSALFTGLVADRNYLREHRKNVTLLTRKIQEVLDEFYNSDDSFRRDMAQKLSQNPKLSPTVGPGKSIPCSQQQLEQFCGDALEHLYKHKVLSPNVRLSKRAWQQAFAIWQLRPDDSSKDCYYFRRCCDPSIGAQAHPSGLRRFFREKIGKRLKPFKKLVTGLVIMFGFVSGVFQLAQRKFDTWDAWAYFLGLVVILTLLGWGFSWLVDDPDE